MGATTGSSWATNPLLEGFYVKPGLVKRPQFRKMEKTAIPLSPAIPRRREMLVPKSEQVHTIESPT
jgi:hypothetical protein